MIASEEEARAWVAALSPSDAAAIDRLDVLARLLVDENTRQNLVSAASLESVWQRHIADSAQLLRYVPRETHAPWIDLGTGAGFPGLVIAALEPEREVVMVESRGRRVGWLERAVAAMELANAKIIGSKLEQVPDRPFGAISARAFAPLDRLVSLAARFSTGETLWLLPKGRSARQELDTLHGWIHTFHVEQSLTDAEAGIIVGTLTGARRGRKGPKA